MEVLVRQVKNVDGVVKMNKVLTDEEIEEKFPYLPYPDTGDNRKNIRQCKEDTDRVFYQRWAVMSKEQKLVVKVNFFTLMEQGRTDSHDMCECGHCRAEHKNKWGNTKDGLMPWEYKHCKHHD